MYIEVLILGALLLFIMSYNKKINVKKFFHDNERYFYALKEDDYDFLLYAKYGSEVDVEKLFSARVRNAALTFVIVIFIFLDQLSYLNVLMAIFVAYMIFRSNYSSLKTFYKGHLHEIDMTLPYYLKTIEILIQHYTVPVAIAKSIDSAPPMFKPGLQTLISRINAGDSTIEPYMEFAKTYPVRDSVRMMRLMYRLSLGNQENKQEQLLFFSRSVSSLQNKSREEKYKARLNKMEGKTMLMLGVTGVGVMILLVISMLSMMSF